LLYTNHLTGGLEVSDLSKVVPNSTKQPEISATDHRLLSEITSDVIQYVRPDRADDFKLFLTHGSDAVSTSRRAMSWHRPATALGVSKRRAIAKHPSAVPVPGVQREIVVKIASTRNEWEKAFSLVANNYRAKGYEGSMSCKVRFTPYHAIPETVTFLALLGDEVLMTMSLVADNTLLGLPLECIYPDEVNTLRRQQRRLGEVISLAASKELDMRESRQTFISLIRLLTHYHVSRGGDTWVITVNPKHSDYYTKAIGYVELGPRRHYPGVEGHPAEAFWVDLDLMKTTAPKKYAEIVEEWMPGEALISMQMPTHLIRFLTDTTSESNQKSLRQWFDYDQLFSSPRRW
jgi:hypothetical protein